MNDNELARAHFMILHLVIFLVAIVNHSSHHVRLNPPLPRPLPRPNLTLGGTNFNEDIAPVRPSMSASSEEGEEGASLSGLSGPS